MEILFTMLAYAGMIVVFMQAWPYLFQRKESIAATGQNTYPLVSIIIPARNEENAIGFLLDSLLKLSYPDYEIIVVDDQSEDDTFNLVSKYPVTLVKAPPKPAGWIGKSWACQIGTRFAKGTLLLFTDADTIHTPQSLTYAVQASREKHAVLLSAPSFHLNKHWWEKLMGPFHFLVTVAATPYNKPTLQNPYAVGQYLLFDRTFYHNIGGHAAIKGSLAEDVDLARLTLMHNGKYQIYTRSILYAVQMYPDLVSFINGWSRLLRLGMQSLSFTAVAISTVAILALTSCLADNGGLLRWIPTLGVLFCMGFVQRRLGNFRSWGILLFPLTVGLFIGLAFWATLYRLLNVPIAWRGRKYEQTAEA